MWIGILGTWTAYAADSATVIPAHTVQGSLDAQARMQAVHAEMQRECSVSPNGNRCHRLKREFQQEAKNCQKQHHK